MVSVDLEALDQQAKVDPVKAISTLQSLLTSNTTENEKRKDVLILKLSELYGKTQNANELASLIRQLKTFFVGMPKSKTAKVVRTLVDDLSSIPNSGPLQVQVCRELIDWCVEEKRVYLKQTLDSKLISIYLKNKMYTDAIALIGVLLRELKRVDDKNMLVEVHLLESYAYFDLRNVPKSKAALTAARTTANAIYCPPTLQAALDLQSGVIHAEEKDFRTAFSYFYEAFEGYASLDSPKAVVSLKYMILCKIMMNNVEDINGILNAKSALRFAGNEMESMKEVAKAYQNRNLMEFQAALKKYSNELQKDTIIQGHLGALYQTLLEQNLVRIIEPFSRVEISHIAELIHLNVAEVEVKLSQMILDKVFFGIIDQGAGCLEIFDECPVDKTYEAGLETIKQMNNVVESLYLKAAKLS